MRKNLILISLLTLGVIAFFVFEKENIKTVKDENIYKATIGVYKGDSSALLIIAKEKGYLKDENLDIEFKFYQTGKDAMDGMLEGEVDYSNGTDFVAIKNSFRTTDFKILGSVAIANINGMIAKKSSNIKSPKDIKNKKVGTTVGSLTEYYTGIFLTQYNLQLKDIDLIDVPASQRYDVIENDKVDALFAWEPFDYNIKKKYKDEVQFFPMPAGFEFYFLFMVNTDFHIQNPQISSKILNALYKASGFAAKNEDAVKKILKDTFNYEDAYINYTLKKHQFELLFPYALTTTMYNQALWLLNNNLVTGEIVNFKDIYDSEPLKKIDNPSVTILD